MASVIEATVDWEKGHGVSYRGNCRLGEGTWCQLGHLKNKLVSHNRALHQNSLLEIFDFDFATFIGKTWQNWTNMNIIWYQIKTYSAANVMSWRNIYNFCRSLISCSFKCAFSSPIARAHNTLYDLGFSWLINVTGSYDCRLCVYLLFHCCYV